MIRDRKYELAEVKGIPDDEPIFLLRAQDAAALATLDHYATVCVALGSPNDHLQGVRLIRDEFRAFQAENTPKVPD